MFKLQQTLIRGYQNNTIPEVGNDQVTKHETYRKT